MFTLKIIYYLLKSYCRPRFRNRAALEKWQQVQIKKHLTWLTQHSPFFKDFKGILFQNLPLFDKKKMMANFDSLNTAKIRLENALQIATQAEQSRDFNKDLNGITVGLSSGTSGNKGIFLATETERALWVAEVLRRVLPIRWFKSQKIAFFLRADSKLYQSIRSRAFEFQFFDLAKPIDVSLNQLNAFLPDIIVAPPSVLQAIAKYKVLNNSLLQPYKIVSVAEVLEKDVQKEIEKVFRQTVHQVYQATEGFLASTCVYGTLHFHEDLILIEKKQLNPENTAIFHPIITDFHRKTQPIVRYELNDIVHLKQTPCACGSIFAAIDHIEGRSDDILHFKTRDKQPVLIFPDFIRYAIVLASDAIDNFQVIQIADNQLVIKLLTSKEAAANCEIAVQKSLNHLFESKNMETITLTFEPFVQTDFFNKFRRVCNLVKIKF
jgi:putative adenylate-forming enzyme